MMSANKIQKLYSSLQLLDLTVGSSFTAANLSALIRNSKNPHSPSWRGEEWVIGNTPQQGINWIGKFPNIAAGIVKVKKGRYAEDGWVDDDDERQTFMYSFKSQKGDINFRETANQILLAQPILGFPILLLLETNVDSSPAWVLNGRFKVVGVDERAVQMQRVSDFMFGSRPRWEEGMTVDPEFISHLLAEGSVDARQLGRKRSSSCSHCGIESLGRNGATKIEFHYTGSTTVYSRATMVGLEDLVPLCLNCHATVHESMLTRPN